MALQRAVAFFCQMEPGPIATQLTDTVMKFLNSSEYDASIPVADLRGALEDFTIGDFMGMENKDRAALCLGNVKVVAAIVRKGLKLGVCPCLHPMG